MRRALVLTNESARHPFRASLPPHRKPPVGNWLARRMPELAEDIRGFAISYVACFLAVAVFIF